MLEYIYIKLVSYSIFIWYFYIPIGSSASVEMLIEELGEPFFLLMLDEIYFVNNAKNNTYYILL